MKIDHLHFDLEGGSLILTGVNGEDVPYKRDGEAKDAKMIHLRIDNIGGLLTESAFDELTGWPAELFVYHKSPGPNQQPPIPVTGAFYGPYRYVRKT